MLAMGRTHPTECKHGNVVDWGDFDFGRRPKPCDMCRSDYMGKVSDAIAPFVRKGSLVKATEAVTRAVSGWLK